VTEFLCSFDEIFIKRESCLLYIISLSEIKIVFSSILIAVFEQLSEVYELILTVRRRNILTFLIEYFKNNTLRSGFDDMKASGRGRD